MIRNFLIRQKWRISQTYTYFVSIIGIFLIRQKWRITQAYTYFVPIIGILNTFLYFIIAVGVTNLFDLTIWRLLIILALPIVLFNILGYFLDKQNVFSKDFEKAFEGVNMKMYDVQISLSALYIAKYMKKSEEEIDAMIENHEIIKSLALRNEAGKSKSEK